MYRTQSHLEVKGLPGEGISKEAQMIENLFLLLGLGIFLCGVGAIGAFVADKLQEWEDGR